MSSLMSRVRDHIAAQGKPCAPLAIAKAIPRAEEDTEAQHYKRILTALGVMKRSGLVERPKGARGLYVLGRDLKRREVLSEDERVERRRARDRARSATRVRGRPSDPGRTWQQYLDDIKARAAAGKDAREAAKKERRRKREAERTAANAAARAKAATTTTTMAKASATAKRFVIAPASVSVTQIAPPKPVFETTEEWMARTGQKPEVLPPPMALKPWEPLPKNRKKAA